MWNTSALELHAVPSLSDTSGFYLPCCCHISAFSQSIWSRNIASCYDGTECDEGKNIALNEKNTKLCSCTSSLFHKKCECRIDYTNLFVIFMSQRNLDVDKTLVHVVAEKGHYYCIYAVTSLSCCTILLTIMSCQCSHTNSQSRRAWQSFMLWRFILL